MNSFLPTYDDFVCLEKKTLTFLYHQACRRVYFGEMVGHIQKFMSLRTDNRLLFDTFWNVKYKGDDCRIYVGMFIEKDQLLIYRSSHYLCIVKGANEEQEVLRKYHFDYQSKCDEGAQQEHPYFHLQYAGKLSPALKNWNVREGSLEPLRPEVEEPRLAFNPVSFAFILNIAFKEFSTREIAKFAEIGEWRSIIRENEEKILYPYFERCLQLTRGDNSVLFDHAYIKRN